MKQLQFFDDEEEGLSRSTSHPRFVELASEDFFYDVCDHFSPFGSDDGNDTLSALEDWYRDGGKDKDIGKFLKQLLSDWDFGIPPGLLHEKLETIGNWLDDSNDHLFDAECRARIATAFGQLKITGAVQPNMVKEGLRTIDVQLWCNERARLANPQWTHANENRERLLQMQSVLQQL